MDYAVASEDSKKRIQLSGRFTFADNQKFRQIVEMLDSDNETSAIDLDFAQVEFIDSAGLGMLLLFRDECIKRNLPLAIRSAHGQVEKIFAISKLDQLFASGGKH